MITMNLKWIERKRQMRKALVSTGLAGLMVAAAMVLPAAASAETVNSAARAYCNKERMDRQDFIRDYGNAGKVGMQRCISREKQLAVRECQAELRTDREDYARQFGGTDRQAFQRCLKYELGSSSWANGKDRNPGNGGGPVDPVPPSGTASQQAARAYCEREQRDPDDFRREYGVGEAGMATCIERETNLAIRECEAELRNDPTDYVRQFGGRDAAAFERCLVYELRS